MHVFERIVRLCLRAYTPQFRERFGDEVAETVVTRIREVLRSAGRLQAAAFGGRELLGIVVSGVRSRLVRLDRFSKSTLRPRHGKGHASLEPLGRELRLAARGLARRPALPALAVGALALGIGATVAVFSLFHAVLLRPLPFREPSRLVAIWEKNPERGWHGAQVAAANYLDWRESAESFDDMAAYNDWLDERVLLVGGEPTVVLASEVTGNFFSVLGVPPLEGRVFDDAHTWGGAEPAAVLSHRFWRSRYSEDRSIIGRAIVLDDIPHRVLGVMPQGFAFPFRDADVWVPVGWDRSLRGQPRFRRAHAMRVVGRLSKNASSSEGEAELAAIAARLERDYPETNREMGNGVTSLKEWIVGDTRRPLQILMGAVLFLLLIVCANVANILLARTNGRQHDFRVRAALGADRGRLVLEGLMESFWIAALGGGLGLVLGISAIRPLLRLSPEGLPRLDTVGIDVPVVLFAVGVSLSCGLVFGALPAWRGASHRLSSGERGGSPSRSTIRATSLLVAAEVALAFPLVVGAGLMLRTLAHLSSVEPGFDSENVTVASVFLPPTRYTEDDSIATFYRELFRSVGELPAVDAVAMSSRLPFGNQRWSSDFTAEGWSSGRYGVGVRHDEVTPGLFRAMGVNLIKGRDFDLRDDLDSAPVVIVNEALAAKYFPGEDALGKRVCFDRTPDETTVWRTIVGVVANVRRKALRSEEEPSFYAPVLQETARRMHVLIRSGEHPRTIAWRLRERVHALDPTIPVFDVKTLESVLTEAVAKERFLLVLLAISAFVALVLAASGVFGVVFHATSRRVREIGIRVALGAARGSVVALVIGNGLRPVLLGMAWGVFAAALLAGAMSSFLFEVPPLDPITFAFVGGIVLLAALAACVIPARWATRIDATSALKVE